MSDDEPPAAPNTLVNAEQSVLGAVIAYPDMINELEGVITGSSFYSDDYRHAWWAIKTLHAAGKPTTVIAVAHEISKRTEKNNPAIAESLAGWVAAAPAREAVAYHAEIVYELARKRDLSKAANILIDIAAKAYADDADIDDAYQRARDALEDIAPRAIVTDRPQNIDEFLAGDEDDYDWVIPGLLERHDRVILTGPEGGGKSTMLRQWGVMGAAGINPFSGENIEPITVLHVDLENSHKQSRRKFRPLRIQAKDLDPQRHYVEVKPSGVDLLDASEAAWLLNLVDQIKPDLFLTGPLYRMATGDPNKEEVAKPVSVALDRIRERGTAIVVEAHTPHALNGQRKRPHRPYGASLWMRWPEFGIHLAEDGTIDHWRGARDEREWPSLLTRGGAWPWSAVTDDRAIRWTVIKRTRIEFGAPMTVRDMAEATGISKSTIARVITGDGPFRTEWDALNGSPNDGSNRW